MSSSKYSNERERFAQDLTVKPGVKGSCSFLELPLEIRSIIYEHVLAGSNILVLDTYRTYLRPRVEFHTDTRAEKHPPPFSTERTLQVIRTKAWERNLVHYINLSTSAFENHNILSTCRQCHTELQPISQRLAIKHLRISLQEAGESGFESGHIPKVLDCLCALETRFPTLAKQITHFTTSHTSSLYESDLRRLPMSDTLQNPFSPRPETFYFRRCLPNLEVLTTICTRRWFYDPEINPTAVLDPRILMRVWTEKWRTSARIHASLRLSTTSLRHYMGFVITKGFRCNLDTCETDLGNFMASRQSSCNSLSVSYGLTPVQDQLTQPPPAPGRQHLILFCVLYCCKAKNVAAATATRLTSSHPSFKTYADPHSHEIDDSACVCNLDRDITTYLQMRGWKWNEDIATGITDEWGYVPDPQKHPYDLRQFAACF